MREQRLFRILTCRNVTTFLLVAVVGSWICRLLLENDRRITLVHIPTSITGYRSPIYKHVHNISEKVQNEDVTFPRPTANNDRDNNPSNSERGGKDDNIFVRFTTFANISDSNIIRDKQVEVIAFPRPETNIVNTENKIKKPTVESTTPAMNTTGDLGDWKNVMLKRKKRVTQICEENYLTLKRFHIDNLFTIDTKHHLAYCRNAKAGTTTTLGYMLKLAGVNITGKSPHWIHSKANKLFPRPNIKTVMRELNGQAVSFLIARHPFTRLVSAYQDKILSAGYQNVKKNIAKKYHKGETDTSLPSKRLSEEKSITLVHNQESIVRNITTNLNSNEPLSAENMTSFQFDSNTTIQNMKPGGFNQPTFREFALYVADIILKCSSKMPGATGTCMRQINVHWRPLHERCAPCDIKYKVYAKMETFEQDIQYLKEGTASSAALHVGQIEKAVTVFAIGNVMTAAISKLTDGCVQLSLVAGTEGWVSDGSNCWWCWSNIALGPVNVSLVPETGNVIKL
ncbi:hypothetical protein Pcinc_025954 [Petrolisthes cinctipes]|uniref:Carbohydrate sulfotransferase n=1 Tax=Petrolisthes cinctipes TaxID=88211 RepID=A0AAE1F7G8_PETCI|nr:hypothetical protein Pcinc_025954 [Petrolisthes cinctipes]